MPRTFTPHELQTITVREVSALSREDAEAFNRQWLAWAIQSTAESEAKYLSRDLDRVDSRRRYRLGE